MSDSEPIQLRLAAPNEASALSALAVQSKSHWPYTAEQLALWDEDLTLSEELISNTYCWVAVSGGHIAGCFVLDPRHTPWPLQHFWVHPQQMGRGVGRALLEKARTLAKQAGKAVLTIDADPHAEAFYLACGAQRAGEISAPIVGQPNRVRPQLLLRV